MTYKLNKSTLTFFGLFLVGFLIAALGIYFLPERFFFDADTIIKDKSNEIGLIGSYPFTIWFYHVTGLKNLHFSIIGILQYSFSVFLLYKIGIPKAFKIVNVKNSLVYLSLFMLAMFLCMPTKEFINFTYMFLIVLVLKRKKNYLLSIFSIILLLLLFGFFFREYYLLVAVIAIFLYLISKIKINNRKIAVFSYGLLVVIALSLSYGAIKGKHMSESSREGINMLRKGGKATNSIIISPVNTKTWYGETIGIYYGFFSVNIPVNGFKHILKPQIILFVFWQLFLFIILLIRYEKVLKKGTKNNFEIWGFYIVFSYFICQGVFEPDLGSAIRHKMGIFPLIYFTLYYDSFRKKIQ